MRVRVSPRAPEIIMKHQYPDDGGLKEPVRPLDETLSAWWVILEKFFGERNPKCQSNSQR